ncbi:replication-relaxation family protein [Minwuia sp.]|uniref:replication-relaxation family protein n=1 Tax=Minwuia sp. TaxID=2493630 RepID=UPI003A8D4C7A
MAEPAPGFDTIRRRKRLQPVSTGKRIRPRPRDLLWFRKIHEHGPLPSSYLHAFSAREHRSEKRAKERLTDLFNEAETPHGGTYLSRPLQQFRTIDSRYNQLVHDLTPASLAALKQAGLHSDHVSRPSGPWLHGFMTACITASIELATLARDDLSFIPGWQVLERAGAPLRFPTPIRDPGTGRTVIKDLIPDALFGLQYLTSEGPRYRFFLVEADRGTEPMRTANGNRKSWMRSLAQYRAYVGGGLYRDHLRLTAPLLVLIVGTEERKIDRMVRLTRNEGSAEPWLLFTALEGFGPVFRPQDPIADLLDRHWLRAASGSFDISRV